MREIIRALTLLAALQTYWGSALGDDVTNLLRQSESFERARRIGDMASIDQLVLADASSLDGKGRELRRLRDDLQADAKRPAAEKPLSRAPVRIVHRDVALHGDAAIVAEMIGADMRAGDHRVAPMRRTLAWTRTDDKWRLAHLHASPYARWEPAITAFESQDDTSRPVPGGVVFIGSSSIRLWKTLANDFPNIAAMGRGFGGSQLIDSVLYAHRMVTPYEPKAVAVYAGDNDIAAGKTPEDVLGDFRMLVDTIHADLPSAPIGFIAIKPSIKRWDMWSHMKRANQLIRDMARGRELVDYLDIATPMLGADGPKPGLFADDGLHLNDEGYALWASVISPWTDGLAERTPDPPGGEGETPDDQ